MDEILTNSPAWKKYKSEGSIICNTQLLEMIHDVVVAFRILTRIDLQYFNIVTEKLIHEYEILTSIARARNMTNLPRLYPESELN